MALTPPRIGALRDRVTLRLWEDTATGEAAATPVFTDVATLFGRLEPIGDGIFFGAIQVGTGVTHRLWLRHRSDLTVRHVVEHGGQRYRVRRVSDLEGAGRFTLALLEHWGAADADRHHATEDGPGFWQ